MDRWIDSELKAEYPKGADRRTKRELSPGAKTIKSQDLRHGQASDIGTAPPMRVYSRDYSKRDPDHDQNDDTLSPFLGNPLRW